MFRTDRFLLSTPNIFIYTWETRRAKKPSSHQFQPNLSWHKNPKLPGQERNLYNNIIMICLLGRCSLTVTGHRAATMETNGVTKGLHSVLDQDSKEGTVLEGQVDRQRPSYRTKRPDPWNFWLVPGEWCSGAPRPHASSHKCCKPASSPFLYPSNVFK